MPLHLSVRPLRPLLRPAASGVEEVLVRIRVDDRPERSRPALTAVLVLDVSSSMAGEPIAQVIGSAERLTELLAPDDALGLVAFDTGARTVSPVRRLDALARRELAQAARSLVADGTTNLAGGLTQALLSFGERRAHERQIAVVMSDGQPNVGPSRPAELHELAAAIKQKGIAISTLGFGLDHDEDVLDAIADAGGGRYAFVSDPRLADASFARALGAQRDIVAEDLRLILAPAAGVVIDSVLGGPRTSVSSEGLSVHLPDAIGGDELNVVVVLKVEAPAEPGPWRPLKATLRYRPLGEREPVAEVGEASVDVARIGAQGEVDHDVAAQAAIARASVARREARALADRGSFGPAAAALRAVQAMLEAVPGFERGGACPLGEAYEAIVDDITAYDNRPDPEAYRGYRKGTFDLTHIGGLKGRTASMAAASVSSRHMSRLVHVEPVLAAELVVRQQGEPERVVRIEAHETDIGRAADAAVRLPSHAVSQRHCLLAQREGALWLFDLHSTNGTRLNGQRLRRATRLGDGDVIGCGDCELHLRLLGPPAEERP